MTKKLLSLLLAMAVLFTACDKKDQLPHLEKKAMLEYSFKVAEQEDVSHYEIQGSSDAKEYKTLGVIFATENETEQYTIKVDVTELLRTGPIYTRIKSVDIDGKELFSMVTLTRPEQ